MSEKGEAYAEFSAPSGNATNRQMRDPVDEIALEYSAADGTPLPIHVFVPAVERPRAGVLLFHGGGWTMGTPEQLYPQCRALAAAGVVAASAGYRFIGDAAASLADCIEDASLAFRHFARLASDAGTDPNRLSAGGASAGGHLAASIALLAADKAAPRRKTPVHSLVLFNPVLDVSALAADRRHSLGITVTEAATLSPSRALRPGCPPTLIFHGTDDQTVPIESIHKYRDEMRSHGDYCRLVEFAGADHGFFNFRPGGNPLYDNVTAEVVRFVVERPR